MKKILNLLVIALSLYTACTFADPSANIRMHISGTAADNTYFLCLPNVGCLSILASDEGKTYPVYHPIEMDGIYVTNIDHNFRLSDEGMPTSCQGTIPTGKTLTITAHIKNEGNGSVLLAGLHCAVS